MPAGIERFFGRAADPFADMAKGAEKLKATAEHYTFKCACLPIPENDGKVENYRDGKKMVSCDRCSIRSHRTCNKVRANVVTWICPACAKLSQADATENVSPNLVEAPAAEDGKKAAPDAVSEQQQQQQQDAWDVYADRKGKAEEEGGLRRAATAPAQKPIAPPVASATNRADGTAASVDEEDPEDDGLSAYERERLARIKRNREMMAQLNLAQAARDAAAAAAAEAAGPSLGTLNGRNVVVYKPRATRPRKSAQAAASEPVARRSSKRLRGPDPGDAAAGGAGTTGVGEEEEEEEPALMTLEAYYKMKGIEPGPLMTGHFGGWVEEGLSGGESAKERSRKMMCKNPNEFFYRHVEPGEEQWKGEWSLKEVEHFVEVAKKHGCGDKWGLFSSYIPHRVGYQCSAVYRQVVIPNGLLQDGNFKISASGICQWAPP